MILAFFSPRPLLRRWVFSALSLSSAGASLAAAKSLVSPIELAPTQTPNGSVAEARRALREFDRFLDHHPLIEDDLRLDPRLLADVDYLEKNTELRSFLAFTPSALPAIRLYPRYFVFRALLRQADAPLKYSEIAQLKEFFERHADLERALTERPEAIRDATFLRTHGPFRQFLADHPPLGRVFLPPAEASSPTHP